MTHEKLVAGTESPTRYTKIIRNPGAGTKYNRTYQETDYVSRYTKLVAGGKDYVPPAPPEPDEPEYEAIKVVTGCKNADDNVYEIGNMVAFTTATYSGGSDSNQYRWRFQERDQANDSWVNGVWTTYDNTAISIVKDLRKGGQLRFQCQARDASQDPVDQVNSFGPVATVPFPPTTIGTPSLTVDDTAHPYGDVIHCVVGQSLLFHMSIDGDASPTYKWEARGEYPMLISEQAASTVLTFPEFGNVTLTCTIIDGNASDSPLTYAMSVYVASEAEWEVTHPSTKTTKSSSNPNDYFIIYGVRRTDS